MNINIVDFFIVPEEDDIMSWGTLSFWLGVGGPWEVTDKKAVSLRHDGTEQIAEIGDMILKLHDGTFKIAKISGEYSN